MYRDLQILILGSVFLLSNVLLGATLDGIFEGTMQLKHRNGQSFSVPLAVALTPTGEVISVPAGSGIFHEEQVIDGAFVIDDEGGPYSFTKVSYRLAENTLDLRYDRFDSALEERPASFRLVGKFDPEGRVTGRVVSGTYGPIGKFVLVPTDLDSLPVRDKYVGTWRGSTTIGGDGELAITIGTSPIVSSNPVNFEFEYTPGRLASISYNGTGYEISEVFIDYLRRRLYLIQKVGQGQSLVFQAEFDPVSQKIWGFAGGASKGRTGTFALEKEKQEVGE
ncbi:MAG: hypothetical protein R3B54_16285 [Bdellovibrionota bacterium]